MTRPRPHADDYLWNRQGEADPLLMDLEQTLGTLAYRAPQPKRVEERKRQLIRWSWRSVRAVAAGILLCIGVAWLAMRPQRTTWEVSRIAGVESTRSIESLRPGQWLETNDQAVLRIAVADIGYVFVQPNSRVRMLASRTSAISSPEHRLELARGSIAAVIDAPPRLFFVNTRAAVAIDYGCEYTLSVDEPGNGLLRVEQGLVMLDGHGRSALVPMNATCTINENTGPGTPLGDHASPQLRDAIGRFDASEVTTWLVQTIVDECTILDTVTLWHVLQRVPSRDRGIVIDRLNELVPMPDGVSREGIVVMKPDQLSRWRVAVERYW